MTTAEAINFICRKLKVPNRSFGYAGMKDKRGITVQVSSSFNQLFLKFFSSGSYDYIDFRTFVTLQQFCKICEDW